MRTVYVLMYWSDEDGMMDASTGDKSPPRLKPYAVFEDAITAEKMKRDGDEIIKVPYFRDDMPNVLRITEGDLKDIPSDIKPWTSPVVFSDDVVPTSPPPSNYPKVARNKTVDEHTWTNRVD